MIDYIEIRSSANRELIGIIDGAKSFIWHSVYYGCGDFEIYIPATERNIQLLQKDNYVSKPANNEIGVIEIVEVVNSITDGSMIIASGRMVKSILDRRHIYQLAGKTNTPTILSGNVEQAIRTVVYNNAISCSFDSRRNINILQLGALAGLQDIIVDEHGAATQKQVSYKNLLEYTDSVLEEYKMSSRITFDDDTKKLSFCVYRGADRSTDNSEGNSPVIFSAEFDNLIESDYKTSTENAKNAALIGGEGEGLDRFYSLLVGAENGLARRETFIDAASISKKRDEQYEYTDAEYKKLLDAQGKQTLSTLVIEETFDGKLNVDGGVWRVNEDYMLGDIVTIQDNKLGIYINVRITEIIETQDESGYSVEITYSSERTEI